MPHVPTSGDFPSPSVPSPFNMATSNYRLKWDEQPQVVPTGLNELRQNRQLVDVSLFVQDQVFHAHKVMLVTCSSYFRKLITEGRHHATMSNDNIVIESATPRQISALLDYMYTGEVSIRTDELSGILRVAETYGIRGLTSANPLPNVVPEAGHNGHASVAEILPNQRNRHVLTNGHAEPVASTSHQHDPINNSIPSTGTGTTTTSTAQVPASEPTRTTTGGRKKGHPKKRLHRSFSHSPPAEDTHVENASSTSADSMYRPVNSRQSNLSAEYRDSQTGACGTASSTDTSPTNGPYTDNNFSQATVAPSQSVKEKHKVELEKQKPPTPPMVPTTASSEQCPPSMLKNISWLGQSFPLIQAPLSQRSSTISSGVVDHDSNRGSLPRLLPRPPAQPLPQTPGMEDMATRLQRAFLAARFNQDNFNQWMNPSAAAAAANVSQFPSVAHMTSPMSMASAAAAAQPAFMTAPSTSAATLSPVAGQSRSGLGAKGKPTVSCEVCGKKLADPSSLYRHRKIHSGEKPHECQYCGRKFIQKYNMNQHIRTHFRSRGINSLANNPANLVQYLAGREESATLQQPQLDRAAFPNGPPAFPNAANAFPQCEEKYEGEDEEVEPEEELVDEDNVGEDEDEHIEPC